MKVAEVYFTILFYFCQKKFSAEKNKVKVYKFFFYISFPKNILIYFLLFYFGQNFFWPK